MLYKHESYNDNDAATAKKKMDSAQKIKKKSKTIKKKTNE